MNKDGKSKAPRLTPNQKRLLAELAASPTGEVVLPFSKAEVARVMWRRGLVASYTSRNGTYVIQTQAAADREPKRPACICPAGSTSHTHPQCPVTPYLIQRWRGAAASSPAIASTDGAPQGVLEGKPRTLRSRASLTRLEKELAGAAWDAYMAGRLAMERDDWLKKAGESRDAITRSMYVKWARQCHHYYLQSARRYRLKKGEQ